MTQTYDFIRLDPSGDVFAVAFDGDSDRIAASCGPISEAGLNTMPDAHEPGTYHMTADDAAWLNSRTWHTLEVVVLDGLRAFRRAS